MQNFDKQQHWETIYQTKALNEVSWYQKVPTTSLDYVKQLNLPLTSKIIDIGGGDSFFVDFLLDLGYTDITIVDISATSLKRAQQRLGVEAEKIKWIQADAANFKPTEKYDFWHDRAAFHFLTEEQEIKNYIENLRDSITTKGFVVMGTFSEQGPTKCSGIEIKQYSETSLSQLFVKGFEKIECKRVNHITPNNSVQNFVFCSFQKI